MFIKFYGARGSIPVSSRATQKYGGNTTCLYIESTSGEVVIIDAGSGIRELGPELIKNKKDEIHLIFTHYHWDHIQGFPFFGPIYFKNTVMKIYGPAKEVGVKKALAYQMNLPYFPTNLSLLPSKFVFKELKNRIKIGNLQIQTISNNHPNYTKGLKFTENNKSIAFLTDNELFAQNQNTPYEKFINFVEGADILIHDAQYTDEMYKLKVGWGHSTYSQVMKLAKDGGIKNIIFTHHDPFSSDEIIDKILQIFKKDFPGHNIKAATEGMVINLK